VSETSRLKFGDASANGGHELSPNSVTPSEPRREEISALISALGFSFSDDRLDGLTAQAGPYLGLIRALESIAQAPEPASEFRFDREESDQ
jgi:hypothetical protein